MKCLPAGGLLASLLLATSAQAQISRPFPLRAIDHDAAREEVRFEPDIDAIQGLLGLDRVRLTEVLLPDGQLVDLGLTSLDLERRGFGIYVDGRERPDLLPSLDLTVWKGGVIGEPGSAAMLAFSNSGCNGWIQRAGQLIHLLPRPDRNGSWIDGEVLLTTEASLARQGMREERPCTLLRPDGEESHQNVPGDDPGGGNAPAPGCSGKECKMAIETDYQLFQVFGDLNSMTVYVTTLLIYVSDRYELQADTVLTFPYMQFYTNSNDPWTSQDQGGNCIDLLYEFRNAWAGNLPNGARIAQFLSGASLGCGVAWLDVLCSNTHNFNVCGNINGKVKFPVVQQPSNWDFMVAAHELGHNFGSPHTHDFCPPLDECAPSGYFGQCQNKQTCTNQGTIMSYCHLCPGGTANITTYFHTKVADILTNRAQVCLPDFGGGTMEADSPELLAPGIPTPVSATIYGTPNGAVELNYRYQGGGFMTVAMTSQGGGVYTADLPPAACDDTPEFYYSYDDTTCGLITHPEGAPGNLHASAVGESISEFVDSFETDRGWSVQNAGASDGDWERGVPVDDSGWAYDPPADYDGSGKCFMTANRPGNSDVDNGAVRLMSPLLDLTAGYPFISYAYYLALTNSDGVDRLRVDVSSNGANGPWIEVARHDTSGGSNWRTHTITPAEMTAAGLTFTANMYVRFTANDDGQQTVVEAAVDAIRISVVRCGLGSVGTSYCGPADPNSTGQPGIIAAIGSDQVVDDDLIVLAGQLPLAEFAILLTSPVRGGSTRSGTITSNGSPGPLCIGVPFGISPQTAGLTDGAGEIEFPVDLSDVPLWSGSTAVMPGQTWYFQVAYRDGLARRLTDALAIQFQ